LIVTDASVVLELLLQTQAAPGVTERLFRPGESLAAPHLIDVEVAQVVRRYGAAGVLDDTRGRQALQDLADLPLTRYPQVVLLRRIWELRHNLTAYDAAYVALAEALEAPLVTRDSRLAAAPGHGAVIEYL
jgi:predicted nucleic acid-binding protein